VLDMKGPTPREEEILQLNDQARNVSAPHFESPKCICTWTRIMHKYSQINRNGTHIYNKSFELH
jgi:hypothetical protein